MTRLRILLVFLPLLILATAIGRADNEDLKDIVNNGKQATALVTFSDSTATGAAFCIDKSGLFLTASGLVSDDKAGEIRLTLNAGETNEQTLTADIVSKDDAAGLAVLKPRGKIAAPALELGSVEDLRETMSLYAFGYALVPAPDTAALSRNITVKVVRVVSLGKSEGVLQNVAIDGALDKGFAGGPLLSGKGKVIGILRFRPEGGGIHEAVPANRIDQFFARPMICFVPPANVTTGSLADDRALSVDVFSLRKGKTDDLEVTISLATASGAANVLKMERKDNSFSVRAPLFRLAGDKQRARARVEFESGEIRGFLDAVVFKAGDKEIALKDIAQIKGGAKPQAILRSGNKSCDIDPNVKLALNVGDKPVNLDLAEVKNIYIATPPGSPAQIKYVITVKSGKDEVGSLGGTIRVEDATTQSSLKINPKAVKCPAALTSIVPAQGGKMLVCLFPSVRKVGVFDAEKRDFTKFADLTEDDAIVTAGSEKFYIAYDGSKTIERWDLKSVQKEQTATLTCTGKIKAIAMGANTKGPTLIVVDGEFPGGSKANCAMFDGENMLLTSQLVCFKGGVSALRGLHAATDGSIFACNIFSIGMSKGRISNAGSGGVREHYILYSPDGQTQFTVGRVAAAMPSMGGPNEFRNSPDEAFLPADIGNYYLGVQLPASATDTSDRVGKATLYRLSDKSFVLPLGKIGLSGAVLKDDAAVGIENRVWLLTGAKTLVVVPQGNDTLLASEFDLDACVFILGELPARALEGETFSYAVRAKTREVPAAFALKAAPEGMTIDSDGVIRWQVPKDYPEKDVEVTVTVSDPKGVTSTRTFILAIVKRSG
jgi:S1-C subfamily serine protease